MTKKDIQNILTFMNRSTLQGNEAAEFVRLQALLQNMLEEETRPRPEIVEHG